jgi:hypothetical protein
MQRGFVIAWQTVCLTVPRTFTLGMPNGLIFAVGMTVLAMDMRFHRRKMVPGIPDTFGKTDAEIQVMPPYVQYFRCNEQIEAGDPGCNDYKYNKTLCPDRAYQASWHPGWKYMALIGHTMAFTLLEVITESLQNLLASEPAEPETLQQKHARLLSHLQELDTGEQEDYDNILNSSFPEEFKHFFDIALSRGANQEVDRAALKDTVNIVRLTKDFSFCHTGLLPAEIRYKGLLTENFEKIGNIMDGGYDVGTWRSDISDVEIPSKGKNATAYIDTRHPGHEEDLVLIMENGEYETCPEETNKDHKDNYYISSVQGWRKLSIPNNSEKEYYKEYSVDDNNGWFIVCLAPCEY